MKKKITEAPSTMASYDNPQRRQETSAKRKITYSTENVKQKQLETDPHIMTAPQLSVDTVSESVSNDSVSQKGTTVNNYSMKDNKMYI